MHQDQEIKTANKVTTNAQYFLECLVWLLGICYGVTRIAFDGQDNRQHHPVV